MPNDEPNPLLKLGESAKLASVAGSNQNNPTWTEADKAAFRTLSAACTPVVTCHGTKDDAKVVMKVTVPNVPDCTHIWVMDIRRTVVAEKALKPGEPAMLEFELPKAVRGVLAFQNGATHGPWKSQPYMKFQDPASGKFQWQAMLSYEKGAAHTAPEVASQWYPQVERHPELLRPEAGRKQLKILYLHGHANNLEIAYRQTEALRAMWPYGHPDISYLEGNVELTTKAHFASVIDYSPQLVELGLSGQPGFALKGYGHIEAPAADPTADPTCQTNCEGVTWAKMSTASMEAALAKLEERIVADGGYDIVAGFSQGGEVVQNLLNRLQAINARVDTKVKTVALFGARIYYTKYGPLTAKFALGEVKAFVCMGQKDNEDIKDASRDTDNLWDLEQFDAAFSAAGIDTITATHPGGHEMPDQKMQGTRQLFKSLYEHYWKGEVNTSQRPPKPTGMGTGLSRNQQMDAIEVA